MKQELIDSINKAVGSLDGQQIVGIFDSHGIDSFEISNDNFKLTNIKKINADQLSNDLASINTGTGRIFTVQSNSDGNVIIGNRISIRKSKFSTIFSENTENTKNTENTEKTDTVHSSSIGFIARKFQERWAMYELYKRSQRTAPTPNPQTPLATSLPKIIHIIWLGDKIPKKYYKEMAKLASAALRSNFIFNLWVDNFSNYWRTARETDFYIPNVTIRNIHELYASMANNSFYQTAGRASKLQMYMELEAIGVKNEAARADCLRYIILELYGGFYFDADTSYPELTFSASHQLEADKTKVGFLVRGNKQAVFGNDMIGSMPHHFILQTLIMDLITNYEALRSDKNLTGDWREKRCGNRLLFTEWSSGPEALLKVLYQYCASTNTAVLEDIVCPSILNLLPMSSGLGVDGTTPTDNIGKWVTPPAKKSSPFDDRKIPPSVKATPPTSSHYSPQRGDF